MHVPPFLLFLVLGPGWCLPPPPPTLNHLGIIKGEYKYMFDLLELERQLPTTHPVTWPPLRSPLVLDVLMQSLKLHPDLRFAAFIYRGLTQGFRIGFNRSSVHLHHASKNHPSALVNPMVSGITSQKRCNWVLIRTCSSPLQVIGALQSTGLGAQIQSGRSMETDHRPLLPTEDSVNDGIIDGCRICC